MIHYFLFIFCNIVSFNADAAQPIKAAAPKIKTEKIKKEPAKKLESTVEKPKEQEKLDKKNSWGASVKAQIQHQRGYFD